MKIVFSRSSTKFLQKLFLSDKTLWNRIIKGIEEIPQRMEDFREIKYLKGARNQVLRFRVANNYRIIFFIDSGRIEIIEIEHRKNIYK